MNQLAFDNFLTTFIDTRNLVKHRIKGCGDDIVISLW